MVMALSADHLMALFPDVDTPFEDAVDVVNRLLPYHVFQHPQIDLDAMRGIKGKAKATEADLLKEEIRGAFAVNSGCRSWESGMADCISWPAQTRALPWHVTNVYEDYRIGFGEGG